jgi:Fic family protein
MAMMEIYPELLNDSKKFKELFRELCQSTIKITEHQNDIVKFKNSIDEGIRIKYLSIEKYEKCKDDKDNIGIEFFNEGNGSYTLSKYDFVTGFPLKELVPEWITEFESQYVVEE